MLELIETTPLPQNISTICEQTQSLSAGNTIGFTKSPGGTLIQIQTTKPSNEEEQQVKQEINKQIPTTTDLNQNVKVHTKKKNKS